MRRSAPSSPSLGVRDQDTLDSLLIIRRWGGGVRGGDEAIIDCCRAKDWVGRSVSSSSESSGERRSSGIVEVSEMKDSLGTWPLVEKCAWREPNIGDDCGSECVFFHDDTVVAFLDFRPVRELEAGYVDSFPPPILRRLTEAERLPLRSRSSENMGSVIGEDANTLAELLSIDTLEVSEIV